MEHIFIITIWEETVRPMFGRFQRGPQRMAVFDRAVGVELRPVQRVDYLRKT